MNYLKGFKTKNGIRLYDYNALGNLPKFKTVNGESIIGSGNLLVSVDPSILKEYVLTNKYN